MLPWIAALAGTLAGKMQGAQARRKLAADIQARNAQRLGGNTDMLDAVTGRQAIDSQEGQAIGGALTNSLVGQLGQPAAPAPRQLSYSGDPEVDDLIAQGTQSLRRGRRMMPGGR